MAGETIITVVGNLTADPELRYTQNGLAVANFTIASTPRNFDRAANDWKDGEALFLRASVWREFAEHVAGSLTKGSPRHRDRSPEAALLRDEGRREAHQHRARGRRDRPQPALRDRPGHPRRVVRVAGGGGSRRQPRRQVAEEPWAASALPHAARRRRVEHARQLQRRDPVLIAGRLGDPNHNFIRKQHHGWKEQRRPPQANPQGQGRQERRPGEGDPRRRHRLQGCRHPSQVHLGARKDPRPSHHRCLRAGAAPHRPAVKNAREMALLPYAGSGR